MTLILIVMAAYMIAMIVIGILGKKNASNFNDYLTAAKRAGMLMIMGSCIGAQIGSGFVVGGSESGASMGIAGAWYGIGCGIAYFLMGFLLSKFIQKHGYVTLSDFFKERYGGKTTRLIYSISTPLGAICSLAAQIMAGAAIFQALGMNGNIGAIIATVVVVIYSSLSGLWGAEMTSVIQVGVILVSLLVGVATLFFGGDMKEVLATLPASSWNLFNLDFPLWVSLVIPTITASIVDQTVFQRLASAKDEKTGTWGHAFGGLIMIGIAILPTLIGMYGAVVHPEVPAASVFWVVALEDMPPIVAALLVSAVLAAVMSTCDCVFLAISATVVHDIYKEMIKPSASEKECNIISWVLNIVVAAIALFAALKATSILSILVLAYTFSASGSLIPFLGGALWKKGTEAGAIAAAAAGIATALLSSFGVINLTFDILSIAVAAVVYVVVSLLTQPKAGKQA